MSGDDVRFHAILEALMSYARQDFSPRLAVSDRRDEIDAIATGVNLLAEELDGEVASRRELEAAYEKLRAAQASLLAAEKLTVIGRLAEGVAHELNNPATWVLLGLEVARARLARARSHVVASAPELAEALAHTASALDDVQVGMERVRTVLADLRALSGADVEQFSALDLNEVVRTACQLARPSYLSVARLVLELGAVPPISGDRGRLGQLVSNLVINAAHAVGHGGREHTILVTTRVDGAHVVLGVEDTGAGIAEELCERVFEPYFTTKPSDIGTGLGLAIVRKIAERHSGTARVTRGTLSGARVEVRLPISPPVTDGAARAAAMLPSPAPGTRARVLVIDDEPLLLRSLMQVLSEEHEVVTVLGGAAGLELLGRDRAFDLVLCDLHMPDVDARTIHEALRTIEPKLLRRFAVMTGGVVTRRAAEFVEQEHPRLVRKPIEIEDLCALVRVYAPPTG
jgi:signal transduction histidine kinase/CheY-like chemotaxis protein